MARHDLTPERKAALRGELRIYLLASRRADEDLRMHVSRVADAGLSLREIAEELEVRSPDTVSRWRAEGEQARNRRSSEDPLRPDERDSVS